MTGNPSQEQSVEPRAEVLGSREARARARASFFGVAEEFTPYLSVDAQRARYIVSTSDQGVSKSLFMRTARGEMRLLARALQILGGLGLADGVREGTFLDVGANIGTTTITAMCSHGFARAVACEPEPGNQRMLEMNLVLNGLERDVEICRAAVADRDGTVEFLVNKRRSGSHEIHYSGRPVPADSTSHAVIVVPQVALDSLAAAGTVDPGDVTFLWMDAQGHEGHILRGASLLTERGVPIVLEFYPGMMDRHGGLDYFKEVAFDRYTHFVALHRAQGKREARFDVLPIGELAAEIERLLGGGRVTDILLVRDPRLRPRHGGGRGREVDQKDRAPRQYVDRELRQSVAIPEAERESFLDAAAALTPLVAVEINDATFFVRTEDEAPERDLFTRRAHSRLELLARSLAILDELELGESVRHRTFVEVGAGTGTATVAALRWHGFSRALACECDPAAGRVLRVNLAANGLGERVRALPVGFSDSDVIVDDLVGRGLIGAGEAGLIWIEAPPVVRVLQGATSLLETGPPVVLRAAADGVPAGVARLLARTHTHLVNLDDPGATLAPIDAFDFGGYGEVNALFVRI
jgi:FkbM family methyltransferase